MRLAQFITSNAKQIIAEWEQFAGLHLVVANKLDIEGRRDHVAGMLDTIAADLDTPQSDVEQARKSKGQEDSEAHADTAANAHGTDRAATGFSPVDLVSEFRALRASVLRLWTEAQGEFSREDLTDVTRFNESIDQLLAESMTTYARDVDHSKDLFLGVLGHDLRNPLGAIMMSATVMMTQEGPTWAHAKTAARILNACTRMDRLIGDLVDFTRSRLGSGIPVARTDMDIATVCRQTVDEIKAFHPRCIVTFEASGDTSGSWDSGRIAQALSNLCGNAIEHGTEGTPIDVAVHGEADGVVLTVRNQGSRIPASKLGEIFSPFKQLQPAPGAKDTSNARSVGLGLYIVQSIVTAHEGTIEVASTDRGTTFTVRLPRSGKTPEDQDDAGRHAVH